MNSPRERLCRRGANCFRGRLRTRKYYVHPAGTDWSSADGTPSGCLFGSGRSVRRARLCRSRLLGSSPGLSPQRTETFGSITSKGKQGPAPRNPKRCTCSPMENLCSAPRASAKQSSSPVAIHGRETPTGAAPISADRPPRLPAAAAETPAMRRAPADDHRRSPPRPHPPTRARRARRPFRPQMCTPVPSRTDVPQRRPHHVRGRALLRFQNHRRHSQGPHRGPSRSPRTTRRRRDVRLVPRHARCIPCWPQSRAR